MKQSFFLLLIMILSLTGYSQMRFGPKVGLNVASPTFIDGGNISTNAKPGLSIGAFFSMAVGSGNKFHVEANYYNKTDLEFEQSGSILASSAGISFISIPDCCLLVPSIST